MTGRQRAELAGFYVLIRPEILDHGSGCAGRQRQGPESSIHEGAERRVHPSDTVVRGREAHPVSLLARTPRARPPRAVHPGAVTLEAGQDAASPVPMEPQRVPGAHPTAADLIGSALRSRAHHLVGRIQATPSIS